MTMVRTQEPTANGATFPNTDGAGICYAEFGMTGVDQSASWQTCLFGDYFSSHVKIKFLIDSTRIIYRFDN